MHLPEPFQGRLLIEVPNIKEEMGVSKDSRIELPDSAIAKHGKAMPKGTIISMAQDAFGDAYKCKFGEDGYIPKIGDVVYFVRYETYPIDKENRYHLVNDCDIVAIDRKE